MSNNSNTMSKRPRIGLTGGRGVLGRSLQQHWADAEWITFGGDIRNVAEVKNWLADAGPLDAVIHFAARVPVVQVEADPLTAFKINVEGTVNLLETIRLARQAQESLSALWVFVASTSHVYASSDSPLKETSTIVPVTLYGQTKWQAEEWGRVYGEKFKLNVCVGRIFSYSSPLQPKEYFIPALIQKIANAPANSTLKIPGLLGTRDFLTTDQISEGVRFLFTRKATGVFNIASGHSQKLLDIALEIRRRLQREDVQIEALEAGTNHLNADAGKLNQLGAKLEFRLGKLLDEMIPRHG